MKFTWCLASTVAGCRGEWVAKLHSYKTKLLQAVSNCKPIWSCSASQVTWSLVTTVADCRDNWAAKVHSTKTKLLPAIGNTKPISNVLQQQTTCSLVITVLLAGMTGLLSYAAPRPSCCRLSSLLEPRSQRLRICARHMRYALYKLHTTPTLGMTPTSIPHLVCLASCLAS